MKLKLIVTALTAMVFTGSRAKDVTIRVENTTDEQREQLVEIDNADLHRKMGLDVSMPLKVRNAFGQEVPVQLTHDGKLIFEVSVRPGTAMTFTAVEGAPAASPVYATGAYYPNRLDDMAWENDRCAYRVYGPALQKRGDRLYGVDIWSKNTREPIVAKRYKDHFYGGNLRSAYPKKGYEAVKDSLFLATSFHLDHGDGLDAYAVGPSLGCGAAALMEGDSLVMPYCYADYEILDNGPLRFTVLLTFPPVAYGNAKSVVEHRLISLDKGMNFNRCELWYDGLTAPCMLAAGVVVHTADVRDLVMDKGKVVYADPTDRPDKLGSQVYVGVLFPDGVVRSRLLKDEHNEGIAGNAVGVAAYNPGTHYIYYFGSAWSCYDVRTFAEWQLRADSTLKALRKPLKVTVE